MKIINFLGILRGRSDARGDTGDRCAAKPGAAAHQRHGGVCPGGRGRLAGAGRHAQPRGTTAGSAFRGRVVLTGV